MAAGVVAMVVLAIRAAWLSRRQDRRLAEERQRKAASRGWSYSASDAGGYVIAGHSGGTTWEFSCQRSGDEDGEVRWQSAQPRAQRLQLALMSGVAERIAYSRPARWIIDSALGLGFKSSQPAAHYDFYVTSQRVESSLSVFQDQWSVRALDLHVGRAVANHRLALLLAEWPETADKAFQPQAHLNAAWDENGVRVNCASALRDPRTIEHIVLIGAELAQAIRRAATT
ncbi:MAG: hypothetical protein SFV54_28575 [Bryobacteraceae bacterium]|nr:hypothetical protein [Bryobacteraceae bacterium]